MPPRKDLLRAGGRATGRAVAAAAASPDAAAADSLFPATGPQALPRASRGRPAVLAASLAIAASLLAGCATSPGEAAEAAGTPAVQAPPPAAAPPAGAPAAAPPARAEARPATADAPSGLPRRRAGEGEEKLPDVELTSKLMFQLLASEIAAQRGQAASAAATYLSMARETRDPRLARRATEIALADRSLERALPAAQLWLELSPDSPLAAQTVETLWLTTGRYADAEPLLRSRLEKARADGTLAEAYGQLQRTLARSPDRSAALAMLDRLSAPDRNLPEALLATAALAHAAQDFDRAAADARAALALRPDDEDAAVAAARYVSQTAEGAPAAIALLDGFVKRQPKAVEARFTLARLLAAAGRSAEARSQYEAALAQEPDSPAILFSLAQLAYQTGQPKLAEDYLRRYVALPPTVQRNDSPAYLFLGQLAEEAGRSDEAIGFYSKVGPGEQFLPALTRRALLLGKTGRIDEGRELLRNTSVATNRERVQLTQVESQMLREAKRYQEAFDVLGAALERLPNNPDLLYDQAMAAERIDRLDVLEANLRKLIALRPDHAHAYNALGYTLADRNIRLEEAQALIEKALALSPDDAHIMDSMGWVLFRRGQLDQAIDWLRRAWKARPEAEIAAHLGEALWKAGRADEARELWREASRREPDNETLRQTLARLNVQL